MRKRDESLLALIIAAIIAIPILYYIDPSNVLGIAIVIGIAATAAICLIAFQYGS